MAADPAMTASGPGPYLMLTPTGALQAFASPAPDEMSIELQTLLPRGGSVSRDEWLGEKPGRGELLQAALDAGLLHETSRQLHAPHVQLDHHLPHAIAGLSGARAAALASGDGFCLARTGFSQEEADTWCVAAADFFDFVERQRQRGFRGTGRAVSFHEGIDMLMPSVSFMLFWVDGESYWLIVGGEPLLNNRALVDVIWSIRVTGMRFGEARRSAITGLEPRDG